MPRSKNHQAILNPFKILGLRPGANQADVKKAYHKRLRQFHPDKGGNPAHTDLITRAYNQIIHDHFQANVDGPVKPSRYNPDQYQVPQLMDHRGFEIGRFNNKFEEHRNFDHNVYQVDPNQLVERDRASYQQERGQVDHEIGQMKPLIDPRSRFNPGTFNQVFQEQAMAQAPIQHPTGDGSSRGTVSTYQEPMASISNLGPATSSNSLVQYTDLDGGGSQGLSNLNYSGFEEGYHPPMVQIAQDPRLNGNVNSRYHDLLQARTQMDHQQSDNSAVNFQADDWNQNQIQMQINNQNPKIIPDWDQIDEEPVQVNLVNQRNDGQYGVSPESNRPSSQALVTRSKQYDQLAQTLVANEYQHKLQLQHMQQAYMQAQVQLMNNLSNLLNRHKMLREQQNQPVQVIQADNSAQVRKLEKEIKDLKKTIAVQDKLLQSISLAQNAS